MTKLRSLYVVGMIALSGAMVTTMLAQTVNLDHRVTANFQNTPLREVLNRVLDESCEYEIYFRKNTYICTEKGPVLKHAVIFH